MKFLLASSVLSVMIVSNVSAQTSVVGEESPYSWNQRRKAKIVLLQRFTVREGEYVSHCGPTYAPMGCQQRIDALVDTIFTAASRYQLDPWMLIGLALETSNFNPFSVASGRHIGILGSSWEERLRRNDIFLMDAEYRRICRTLNNACQENLIEDGARILRGAIEQCSGNVHRGLQRYNIGRCNGNPRFARHVLRFSRRLQEEASTIEDIDICQLHPMMCVGTDSDLDLEHDFQ